MVKNNFMHRTGLSATELAFPGVVGGVDDDTYFSHDSISEPYFPNQSRFSLADSTALLAASVAAPSSSLLTKFINCQE